MNPNSIKAFYSIIDKAVFETALTRYATIFETENQKTPNKRRLNKEKKFQHTNHSRQ